ncbi:MAG: CPBP family intramembrane metalloprotease [Clostridia bacterium]|nr:CPBP family intramembrane metalloprotease [Clostridia bacterium]
MKEQFFSQQNEIEQNVDLTSESAIRKPTLLQVSLLFSVSVLLLIFVGSRVQHAEFYSGILITEFILVLIPALAVLFIFRYDVKKVLRLNKLDIKNMLLIVGMLICALPLVGIVNLVNLVLIKSIFGRLIINQPPVAETGIGLIISILVIGGSAGICEEVLFRGTIQRGFERFGAVKSVLITAFLFSLMHVDFQKLLGIFALGALIGFIVYRTNSIYGGMLAHFTNNTLAVVLSFGANKLSKIMDATGAGNKGVTGTGDIDMSFFTSLPKEQQIVIIVVWVIMALVIVGVFGGLFTLCFVKFLKRTSRIKQDRAEENEKKFLGMWLGLLPGVAAVVFIYFAQGLKMRGIVSPVMDYILRIIGLK